MKFEGGKRQSLGKGWRSGGRCEGCLPVTDFISFTQAVTGHKGGNKICGFHMTENNLLPTEISENFG